jgi:glycerol-3-phosphate dehydrogenase subunit C
MKPIDGGIAVHIACHARAQNMGQKAAEMLRLLPEADVQVVERCSGHGGSWGCRTENFATALKVGEPTARQMRDAGKAFITSECPLAGLHIQQGIDRLGSEARPTLVRHPIQLLARAYGIGA